MTVLMLVNLVLGWLDFRLAICPRIRARVGLGVRDAKDGVCLAVLLSAVVAKVCTTSVAVLASWKVEDRRARLGCRVFSARLSASSESESVQS